MESRVSLRPPGRAASSRSCCWSFSGSHRLHLQATYYHHRPTTVGLLHVDADRQTAAWWLCTTWVWWITPSVSLEWPSMTADITSYDSLDQRRTLHFSSTSSMFDSNNQQVVISTHHARVAVTVSVCRLSVTHVHCGWYADILRDFYTL